MTDGALRQESESTARRGFTRARRWVGAWARDYFRARTPSFARAFFPALALVVLVFVRHPASNYIFDEQEAILANPFLNQPEFMPWDAFRRDFWGLPPTGSIGSYRPLPNLLWWGPWRLGKWLTDDSAPIGLPWALHFLNLVGHAVNAALVTHLTWAWTRRRLWAWLAGAVFALTAVLTEAVTGIVGLADVLGGLGVLLSLLALGARLYWMPFLVAGALSVGLLSKESALVAVPLLGWTAFLVAPALHSERPLSLLRGLVAFMAALAALVGYTYFRRHFFPVPVPEALSTPLPEAEIGLKGAAQAFLEWFRQPPLPKDPINNPLVEAELPERIAGALRVYVRGLGQLLFPLRLSGDYSFPQEPIPSRVWFPESVLGGLFMVGPPLIGVVAAVVAKLRGIRLKRTGRPSWAFEGGQSVWRVLAIVGLWVPLAYFPHSNIAVLLPTVRAERFWYLPAIGSSLLIALVLCLLIQRFRRVGLALVLVFIGFQTFQARRHALHYSNDLEFWQATARAAPNSAKAHLNYSVMLGARQRYEERLVESRRAVDLAPEWAMAHVYLGDTLCRLKRPLEGFPHYRRGFELAPNNSNLIALGMQCIWDQKALPKLEDELLELSEQHPGSWLAYLASDLVYNGEKYKGVDPKYRPRGYNEGPKK